MPTVKQVIEQLGTPPADICADWGLQLNEFDGWREQAESAASEDLADQPLPEDLAQPHVAWSLVAIDSQGVLVPHDPTASSTTLSKRPLLELKAQLERWSQSHEDESNSISHQPQLIQVVRKRRSSVASRYGAATALIFTAVLLSLYWFSSDELPESQQQPNSVIAESEATLSTPTLAHKNATSSKNERSDVASPMMEVSHSLQTLRTASQVDASAELLLDQSSYLEKLQQVPLSGIPSESGDVVATSMKANSSPSKEYAPNESPLPPTQIVQSSDGAVIDVLSELSSMAKSAEGEPLEQVVSSTANLKGGENEGANGTSPLALTLSPAIQVQTFDKAIRPREPVWKLRLSVSEEFTVEPADVQVIESRDWASWVVREVKQPSTKPWFNRNDQANNQHPTQVTVQVQLVKHRQTSLRWRIVAGASDFPGLGIPLDQSWLERAQSGLRTQAQWLNEEKERTQMLSRVDGLPSATRSGLTARRRALETQHKLATRCLEIVADANQFPAWLDGQLNVHAQLTDSTHTPSPTLLQFGDP